MPAILRVVIRRKPIKISLRVRYSPEGLSVVEKIIEKFVRCAVRIYEQERGSLSAPPFLTSSAAS